MTRPPVVLVHGLFAPRATMLPFAWALERAGLQAHTVKLPPLNTARVERSVGLLARQIDEILAERGAEKCDLVGMSLGGLIALSYVQEPRNATRVRRLIAVGTPVHGTWSAAAAVGLLGPLCPAGRQCLPGSDLLRDLAARGLPVGVEVTSVYGSFDPVAPAKRCHLEGARNIEIKTLPQPLAHQTLIASPEAVRTLMEILKA
ncbi:MAG: alpha/beta fold hydrolase [Pseudomonadota bacterium]